MSLSVSGVPGEDTDLAEESFFAWPVGVLGAGALVVVVAGREVVVGLEDAESEARGAERAVEAVAGSAAGREASGRFAAVAAAVVEEGASDWREKVLPGEARGAAALAVTVAGVLRTAGFLFSSPDVSDARSGSASDVVLEDRPARLAAVPGAGRVGGLFRLDAPSVLVRVLVAVEGLDAPLPVEARAVVDGGAVGLRALDVVPVAVVVGLRGGTASLDVDAMLRRSSGEGGVGVVGVENGVSCCVLLPLPVLKLKLELGGSAPPRSALAWLMGAILGTRRQGWGKKSTAKLSPPLGIRLVARCRTRSAAVHLAVWKQARRMFLV